MDSPPGTGCCSEGKAFATDVNRWLSDTKRFDADYEIDLRQYREIELDSPA